jgi:16S rRNA (cytidine1402-2'-O)-methyltransferase
MSSKSKHEAGVAQSGEGALAIKMQLESGLWLVATPIGNLGDFSPRAQKTLQSADLILAEDTRMTRKLMGLIGISGKVERCDETATQQGLQKAIAVLAQGGAVAFCSDAGTPGISDPGERLARGVIEAGYQVRTIPGASAAIAALTISGLPTGQFMFAGFSPSKENARLRFLRDLMALKTTLIIYETGPRLAASLANMLTVFGDRHACVARELTKMYEETRRGLLSDLVAHYGQSGPTKGEIVVVVSGAPTHKAMMSGDELDAHILTALSRHKVKDAANLVADQNGLSRRDVYARALTLRDGAIRT